MMEGIVLIFIIVVTWFVVLPIVGWVLWVVLGAILAIGNLLSKADPPHF